jgi:hypothetical protein
MRTSPRARFFARHRPTFGTTAFDWWLIAAYLPRLLKILWMARRWRGIRSILGFLLPHKRRENPSEGLYVRRRGHCRGCPIFNRHLGTCGTPGNTYFDPNAGEERPTGCYCLMAIKAATECNCWAYETTKGSPGAGWPRQLNSDPI